MTHLPLEPALQGLGGSWEHGPDITPKELRCRVLATLRARCFLPLAATEPALAAAGAADGAEAALAAAPAAPAPAATGATVPETAVSREGAGADAERGAADAEWPLLAIPLPPDDDNWETQQPQPPQSALPPSPPPLACGARSAR